VDGELRWAVTDGPDGTHAVVLPDDRRGALALVAHYRGRFWCSTQAGGCGARLLAGARGFRHSATDSWCRFAHGDAGPAYEHLRYEPALGAWLAAGRHQPRLRKLAGPTGAIDLEVAVADVDVLLVLQLSPLSDAAWRERDDAHRRQHRYVVWFYGPDAEGTAATEASVRGTALQLRRQGRGLVVGVRDADNKVRWVSLAVCRLTGDGVAVPGLDEARAAHRRRASERRQAARRAAGYLPPVPEQLAFPM
jgi:hypothetical protein